MSLLIKDGWNLDGLIPGVPGLHDDVRFTYRPALPDQVQDYVQRPKTTAAAALDAQVLLLVGDGKAVKGHVERWEAKDDDGTPIPLTPEVLRTIHWRALQQMVDHVCGFTATKWSEALKNSVAGSGSL